MADGFEGCPDIVDTIGRRVDRIGEYRERADARIEKLIEDKAALDQRVDKLVSAIGAFIRAQGRA